MLFNSLAFAFFLPIVFLCYWFLVNKNLKHQNILLILVSYFFYGWWDWRFLILIVFSSISDYLISIEIDKHEIGKQKRRLLYLSVFINLSTLFFFKYFNFFIENFVDLFSNFGYNIQSRTLDIILPVGISFYTFQSMSYTIDVYRKDVVVSKKLSVFLAYISFFPQLVAGPIERASQLIPQFKKKRTFSYTFAVDGMRQILWGFFKKVVIADNCATYVNQIFDNYGDYSGSTLFLGVVLFAFQIYGDFSGYSDIAIGTAKLFGFNLMENFRFPFFSISMTDFWRRWHISLSSWLRDYLFTPLTIRFRQFGLYSIILSTFISFILIGFWHGANWTFIVFGLLYGLVINFEILTKKRKKRWKKKIPIRIYKSVAMSSTFFFFLMTLVLFRSSSLQDSLDFYYRMFSTSFFSVPNLLAPKFRFVYVCLLILIFITSEWFNRHNRHTLELKKASTIYRWSIYLVLILSIIVFAKFNQNDFIYFQF